MNILHLSTAHNWFRTHGCILLLITNTNIKQHATVLALNFNLSLWLYNGKKLTWKGIGNEFPNAKSTGEIIIIVSDVNFRPIYYFGGIRGRILRWQTIVKIER